MATEDLLVDGFDSDKLEWTRVGSSPYLDAIDDPTNYIHIGLTGKEIGDFSFANPTGSGTINSVLLKLYCWALSTLARLDVFVWDGVEWHELAPSNPPDSYGWIEVDVSLILDTWAKITAAKVYFDSAPATGNLHLHLVDAFSEVDAGWTRVGTNPWLISGSQDHIYTDNKDTISEFSFPSFYEPTCTFSRCRLIIYCKQPSLQNDQIQLWLWDGSAWNDLGEVTPNPGAYGENAIELAGIIDTVEEFNAMKLKLKHNATGAADLVYAGHVAIQTWLTDHEYVDAMKLTVDYTPVVFKPLVRDGLVSIVG